MGSAMRKTTRIDMHVHTKGSDGFGTPKDIAAAVVRAGLDGLCITDHHCTHTAEGLRVAKACRERGLLVFRGCEYSTAQGHLLVYGVDVADLHLGRYPQMQAVVDEVDHRGGVCIPAHPYLGYKRHLGDTVLDISWVPAIEVANGQCAYRDPHPNTLAVAAATKGRLAGTGGSDAHRPADVGLTYTKFSGRIDCEREFLELLRMGHCQAITSRKRVRVRAKRYKVATLSRREDWSPAEGQDFSDSRLVGKVSLSVKSHRTFEGSIP